MLEAKLRDSKLKGRKFRNMGLATGTIKRLNGDVVPIVVLSHKLDKHFLNTDNSRELKIELEGEIVNAWVVRTQKDVVVHNTINIDLKELS